MSGNSGTDDTNDDEARERALEDRLRVLLAAERARYAAPSFEKVMADAQAPGALRQSRGSDELVAERSGGLPRFVWGGVSALAAVLMVVVYLGGGIGSTNDEVDQRPRLALPAEIAISEAELVADLNRTTRWQAPSDRWLMAQADVDVMGLPDIARPPAHEWETKRWL